MSEFEDNFRTMKFEAVKETPDSDKPHQNRSRNDEFTKARKGRGYEIYEKKERGNGVLIAVICVLSVLIVAVIVATILILKADKKEPQPQNDETIVQNAEDESEEDEEIPEVQNKVISCGLVFYPETAEVQDDGSYEIKADFIDSDGSVFDAKRIVLDEDTDIRQDGQRLALEGFIYYLEETNSGDKIVFDGEVKEEDYIAMAISFETPPEEELPEDMETGFIEGETQENPDETKPVEEVDGI